MYTLKRNRFTISIVFLLAAMMLSLFTISASAENHKIGDVITFGTYEQDNNRRDGAEDIQ